jgi:hypothetical protein
LFFRSLFFELGESSGAALNFALLLAAGVERWLKLGGGAWKMAEFRASVVFSANSGNE